MTILDMFSEAFPSIRGALFMAYMILGGLAPASLTFTTTRVGELMKQPPAQERFRLVLKLNPQASLVSPLRQTAIRTRRAALLCFGTALSQVTLGMPASAALRGICVILAICTGAYVAHLVWRTVGVYLAWLDEYDQDLREKAA